MPLKWLDPKFVMTSHITFETYLTDAYAFLPDALAPWALGLESTELRKDPLKKRLHLR